jgi:hypothetical protein
MYKVLLKFKLIWSVQTFFVGLISKCLPLQKTDSFPATDWAVLVHKFHKLSIIFIVVKIQKNNFFRNKYGNNFQKKIIRYDGIKNYRK